MAKAGLLGAWGESLTAEYLRKKGYRIAACNYRCRYGEIDIIARKGPYLVFVEVKLRHDAGFAEAKEFVDSRKQGRIRATASFYLSCNDLDLPVRFDVVEVYAPDGIQTKNPIIHHLEDAFQ